MVFFDGANPLGPALPGIGHTWAFELDWAGTPPQTRHLRAEVTTEDGTVFFTPVQSFLVADPAKFIRLSAEGTPALRRANAAGGNGAETPAYGQFIGADADGRLEAFLFYPESLGDPTLKTGAHFEFPSGATVQTQNGVTEIEFTAAKFYRGHVDPSPLVAAPGTHRLNINAVTPAAVAAALELSADESMGLLWAVVPVRWLDGALSQAGWAGLNVRLPIGEFLLPSDQECALVSFDPRSGDPRLVVCYHGQWTPFAGGPLFRIPRAEPLKLYLSLDGTIAAHGTVETVFPNGAEVRGSVAWRAPNFELRFQGRNIVIPALGSLQRALPTDPEACLPSVATSTELDAAAACLASLRDTYRWLALGGLAEVDLARAETFAPLPTPTDSVGAALGAWAARLASWSADRAGQTLDAEMLADLLQVVSNAARSGEAAHDLPTVLQLLRGVLLAARHLPSVAPPGALTPELQAQLDEAQTRLFAAADRIVSATPGLEPSPELAAIVAQLAEAQRAAGTTPGAGLLAARSRPLPQGGGDLPGARLRAVMQAVQEKLGLNFLARRAIAVGDFEGNDNPVLSGMDTTELLGFLEELVVFQELLRAQNLATSADNAPQGIPLLEALLQVRPNFERLHNQATSAAIASRDYSKLRAVVAERARYFAANARLGLPLPITHEGFFPLTPGLIHAFSDVLEGLPTRTRAAVCGDDWAAVDTIASTTLDGDANAALDRALAVLSSCNDLLTASTGADVRCDDLAQALLGAGFQIAPREPTLEGVAFPDVSGSYESVEDGTESYVTLQLNQGGRYLRGAMQLQTVTDRRTATYLSWTLEGLFLRQTAEPGTMEFALRAVENGTGAVQFLRGTARREATGLTTLVLGAVPFVHLTDQPIFSDALLNRFEQEQRDAIRAAQQNPMHRRVLSRVVERARALRLIIERYYSDVAGEADEQQEASNLNDALENISLMVTESQRPLARLAVRQVLSSGTLSVLKSKAGATGVIGGRIDRSYWELALGMAFKYPLRVTQATEMLGVTPRMLEGAPAALAAANNFIYTITIVQRSLAPVKVVAGATDLDVSITKLRPDGTIEGPYLYDGSIITVGPSVGAGITFSDSTRTFTNAFNFGPGDFEGEVRFIQGGVGFALADLGVSAAVSGLEILGSGRFPPIEINLSEISAQRGYALSLGVDIGGGVLVQKGTNPEPQASLLVDDLIRFEAEASARFDQAVFFEVDGDRVSACGLQFLREFVAEYRSLFEAPQSFIEIQAFTDRTASEEYNLDLSQRRAASVREVLLGLVGPDLAIVPENISA